MKDQSLLSNKLNLLGTFSVGGMLALAACSSSPTTNPYSEVAVPSDEVQTIEHRFENARTQHTDILAPSLFDKASDKFKDAKKELAHQAKSQDILKPLAQSRAYLDQAEAAADRTRKAAPELLAVRDDAMKADASHLASDKWKKAESRLKHEMEEQESNNTRVISADDRKEIQTQYIMSQTAALKAKYLARSKEVIRVLDDQGAKKLVPTAFTEAKSKLVEAEGVIDANRNDMNVIQTSTASAEKSAMTAKDLFMRAKGVKEGSPEQAALAMAAQDQKNTALTQNLDRTQDNLAATQNALSHTQSDLTDTKADLTKSNQERKMFKSQAEMQQYVASMQDRFDPNQAEVYQQGANLLIRVKGTGFSSGRSEIPSKSTPLFAKIQTTIQEFPNSDVIVEGHTDSVGGNAQNQQLSQARAEAIKTYLVSNNAVAAEHITAKGYGSQKPITSNKTASGRAQNRRVDILIENVTNFDKGASDSKSTTAPAASSAQ